MKHYAALRLQRLRHLPRLQGRLHQALLRRLRLALSSDMTVDFGTRRRRDATKRHPRRLDGSPRRHRPGHRDRRPAAAGPRASSATTRSCSPTATASPTSTSERSSTFHERTAGWPRSPPSARRPASAGSSIDGDSVDALRREAADERGLDQRRLLRARAGHLRLHRRRRRLGPASRSRACADAGQLAAYRHEGFWQCMDTLRDKIYLHSLWDRGEAPWKTWA